MDMGTTQRDDIAGLLEKMNENLKRINQHLSKISEKQDEILASFSPGKPSRIDAGELNDYPLDVVTLLSLPDHLRKTAMILCQKGEATAEEIAGETGRARAVESGYLNQLYTMRYIKKRREGRDVYFYVER